MRRDANTKHEKAHWGAAHSDHISSMLADRRLDARLRCLAEMGFGRGVATESIMYITIDGMDQAKFRCPRNLDSSKEFDSCWRPQLHVVGAVMPGALEAFYVMNMDVVADSNLTMTVLSRTIEHAEKVITTSGRRWPEHLVLLVQPPTNK